MIAGAMECEADQPVFESSGFSVGIDPLPSSQQDVLQHVVGVLRPSHQSADGSVQALSVAIDECVHGDRIAATMLQNPESIVKSLLFTRAAPGWLIVPVIV